MQRRCGEISRMLAARAYLPPQRVRESRVPELQRGARLNSRLAARARLIVNIRTQPSLGGRTSFAMYARQSTQSARATQAWPAPLPAAAPDARHSFCDQLPQNLEIRCARDRSAWRIRVPHRRTNQQQARHQFTIAIEIAKQHHAHHDQQQHPKVRRGTGRIPFVHQGLSATS